MNFIKKASIFLSIVEIILIITASFCIYLAQSVTTTRAVFVPKGNIKKIISYLDKQNLQISPIIDALTLRAIGSPQAGWIDMGATSMSKADFLYRLTTAKAYTKQVIIYPGETTHFVLEVLAKEYNLSLDKLKYYYEQYAPFKEASILAESYNIPIGISEENLIKHLVTQSLNVYKKLSKNTLKSYNKKEWKKYLTIASIIQKEAGNIEEMRLVSSVIHNRLKKNMKLQMDGALNYGEYSHKKITPKRIREDESGFNTYKNEGLPPSAVCVVSMDAIKAALNPQKSEYLYFMRNRADKNHGHVFTKTYNEHVKQIKIQRKL